MPNSKNNENVSVSDIYTLIDSKLKFNDFSLRKYLDTHSKNIKAGNQRPDSEISRAGSPDDEEFLDKLEHSSKKKKKLLLLRSLLNENNIVQTLELLTGDLFLSKADVELKVLLEAPEHKSAKNNIS